jgi:hypothetical protein
MLQNISVYFQWLPIAPGGSGQHTRDMEQEKCHDQMPDSSGLEPLDVSARATAIENVFRDFAQKQLKQVEMTASEQRLIREAAINLVWHCLFPPSAPTRLTRKVGRKTARKELDDFADQAEKFVECFYNLSGTAITALGGPHIVKASEPKMKWLLECAEVARKAKVDDARDPGASKNRRANYAAGIVIHVFESMTGYAVDRSSKNKQRGLEPLVRTIFSVLGIEATAKAAIDAAERWQRSNLSHKPDRRTSATESAAELFKRMQSAGLAKRSPRHWAE